LIRDPSRKERREVCRGIGLSFNQKSPKGGEREKSIREERRTLLKRLLSGDIDLYRKDVIPCR
jgi:hypothetical protein